MLLKLLVELVQVRCQLEVNVSLVEVVLCLIKLGDQRLALLN